MHIIPKRQEMASQLKGKIMKYFIAIFTAVLLSLGFIACGDEESDTAVEDTAADAADDGDLAPRRCIKKGQKKRRRKGAEEEAECLDLCLGLRQ